MKKYIAILIFSLVGMFAVAQPPGPPHKEGHKPTEKLKALHRAYVNDKLDLNEEERTFFWDAYGSFKKRERQLMKELRPKKRPNLRELSDEDLEAMLERKLLFEEKRASLRREFVNILKQKIPIRKIIHLEKIERDFKREVMKRMKGQRGDKGGRPPRHDAE